MTKLILFVLLTYFCAITFSASILDYLTEDAETRDDEIGQSNCICNGPSCICCVDFNMTYIDLGGPGCVRLQYLSAEEGIALNVSYGDSLLHSQRVKGPDPAPTCLSMFARLAQMCARFSELLPTDDGLRGCLQLEPMLLGEVQIELPLGCFKMGPHGMEVIKSSKEEIKEQEPAAEETTSTEPEAEEPQTNEEEEETEKEEVSNPSAATNATSTLSILDTLNTADILAAVSESTDEGIAMISNWLGLNINRVNKPENETESEPVSEKEEN